MTQVIPDDEDVIKSDVSKSDMSRSDEEKLADVDNLQPGDDLTSPPLDMSDVDPVLTLENPNPPMPKEVLQDIDLTPFIRWVVCYFRVTRGGAQIELFAHFQL